MQFNQYIWGKIRLNSENWKRFTAKKYIDVCTRPMENSDHITILPAWLGACVHSIEIYFVSSVVDI